jgi:Vitamin K-dependent gamma-carboxylase
MSLIRRALTAPARALETYLLAPIDARAYAITRISYGLLCLGIVIEQWPLRAALFSSAGVVMERTDLPWYLPLAHVRSPLGITLLMTFTGAASICLIAGLFTRAALFYIYVWSVGYCAVAYPAEAGYDAIARIACFVLLCSPTIRAWSLDGRWFGRGPTQLPRYGLRLLQWQLTIIYLATVWLKAPDTYWRNGELMAYFMMSLYSRVPSPIWAELGRTSVLLTWSALVMETLVPFLLFGRLRRLGFLFGFLLHGGICFTSTIGMFSLAMVPLYASFVTEEDVRDLRRLLRLGPEDA